MLTKSSLSASGGATLSISDSDVDNEQATTAEGNTWSMGDSITMTGSGDMVGLDGLSWGTGYGTAEAGEQQNLAGVSDSDTHATIFANYSAGPVTFGYQKSEIQVASNGGAGQITDAWGVAFNVNDSLSVSYGEREVEYGNASAAHVVEDGEGIAVAYTMGSMKIAGNRNEASNNNGTAGSNDQMTEIALSFAF